MVARNDTQTPIYQRQRYAMAPIIIQIKAVSFDNLFQPSVCVSPIYHHITPHSSPPPHHPSPPSPYASSAAPSAPEIDASNSAPAAHTASY